MMALCTCGKYDFGLVCSLFFVPLYYGLWKLIYSGCNKLAERIVTSFAKALSKYVSRKQREAVEKELRKYLPPVFKTESETSETEANGEEDGSKGSPVDTIIKEQIKRDEIEKLEGVVNYTRNVFLRLGFGDGEVTQIVECVRYFVSSNNVLSPDILCIKRKSNVTQACLKNFAWNIARQYSIDGNTAAKFVKYTFKDWFGDTEISSIVKTLKNTKGCHAVEIDENILKVRA